MNGKFNVVRAKNVTILCFNPTLRTPADYRLAGVKSKNQLVRRWISDRAKKELPLNVARIHMHAQGRVESTKKVFAIYSFLCDRKLARPEAWIDVTAAVYQARLGTSAFHESHRLPGNPTADLLDLFTIALIRNLPTVARTIKRTIEATDMLPVEVNILERLFEGSGGAVQDFERTLQDFALSVKCNPRGNAESRIEKFAQQAKKAYVEDLKKTQDLVLDTSQNAETFDNIERKMEILQQEIVGTEAGDASEQGVSEYLDELEGAVSTDLS
jgi:hypothetical protein